MLLKPGRRLGVPCTGCGLHHAKQVEQLTWRAERRVRQSVCLCTRLRARLPRRFEGIESTHVIAGGPLAIGLEGIGNDPPRFSPHCPHTDRSRRAVRCTTSCTGCAAQPCARADRVPRPARHALGRGAHSGKGMGLRASQGQSAPRGSGNTDRCCVVQRRQCSFSLEPQEYMTTRFVPAFCQLSEATEYDILLHV